jgi:hypothetical protein
MWLSVAQPAFDKACITADPDFEMESDLDFTEYEPAQAQNDELRDDHDG